MKIFLETNVLVSALTTRGLCWDLLNEAAKDPVCELLVSEAVLTEFTRTLTVKLKAPPEKVSQAGAPLTIPIPDPDDAPILASALAARADLFVTGDKALLDLAAVAGTAIVSPRECWIKLRGTG